MSNKWLFKIELKDKSVFDEYEQNYHIKFPSELKDFIMEKNASSPELNTVDINETERVYDETLSFNAQEEEASTFNSAMNAVNNNEYLPFAQDPFGNYFCYYTANATICFYNHEEDRIENTDISFQAFIDSLH